MPLSLMTIVAAGILIAKGESMKLLLAMLLSSNLAYSFTQSFEAIAKHQGRIDHFERHELIFDGHKLTKAQIEYVDRDGNLIAQMESDFTHHGNVPDYSFVDFRHGIHFGLKWQGDTVEVFSQQRGENKVQRKNLGVQKKDKIFIAGPGLVYFIKKNLYQIIERNGVSISFIRPGTLKLDEFFLIPLKHTKQRAEFEVRRKPWWLHLFSPRLRLVFELPSRRIIAYEGFSNLRDREGNFMSVDIQYIYEN